MDEPNPPPAPAAPPPAGPRPEPAVRAWVRPTGPGLLAAIGWLVVVVVAQAAAAVAAAVGLTALAIARGEPRPTADSPLLIASATAGTLAAAATIAGLRYGQASPWVLALRPPRAAHLALVLLLAPPGLVSLGEATAWTADAFRTAGLPEGWVVQRDLVALRDRLRASPGWAVAVGDVVFGGLCPGIGEEMFFRGFVGRGLVARWEVGRGVLLTSLLFGAMHVHPVHAAVATLIGVGLHAVYLWTRSLAAPIALHAWYNCLAFAGNLLTRGTPVNLAADAHVPPVVAAAAALASAGVGWLLYRTWVRWAWADGEAWSPRFPTAESPPAAAGVRLVGGRAGPVAVAAVAAGYVAAVAAVARELVG